MKKLKHLTIVSLSYQSKSIPYQTLQQQLEMADLRELEDLIIDAIYQGLIIGKLDQKEKILEVEAAIGRDLKPESIGQMLSILAKWTEQSDRLLTSIKEKINHANFMWDEERRRKQEFEKRVEVAKDNLKIQLETEAAENKHHMFSNMMGMGMHPGMDMEDFDRRKGHSKKGPHGKRGY